MLKRIIILAILMINASAYANIKLSFLNDRDNELGWLIGCKKSFSCEVVFLDDKKHTISKPYYLTDLLITSDGKPFKLESDEYISDSILVNQKQYLITRKWAHPSHDFRALWISSGNNVKGKNKIKFKKRIIESYPLLNNSRYFYNTISDPILTNNHFNEQLNIDRMGGMRFGRMILREAQSKKNENVKYYQMIHSFGGRENHVDLILYLKKNSSIYYLFKGREVLKIDIKNQRILKDKPISIHRFLAGFDRYGKTLSDLFTPSNLLKPNKAPLIIDNLSSANNSSMNLVSSVNWKSPHLSSQYFQSKNNLNGNVSCHTLIASLKESFSCYKLKIPIERFKSYKNNLIDLDGRGFKIVFSDSSSADKNKTARGIVYDYKVTSNKKGYSSANVFVTLYTAIKTNAVIHHFSKIKFIKNEYPQALINYYLPNRSIHFPKDVQDAFTGTLTEDRYNINFHMDDGRFYVYFAEDVVPCLFTGPDAQICPDFLYSSAFDLMAIQKSKKLPNCYTSSCASDSYKVFIPMKLKHWNQLDDQWIKHLIGRVLHGYSFSQSKNGREENEINVVIQDAEIPPRRSDGFVSVYGIYVYVLDKSNAEAIHSLLFPSQASSVNQELYIPHLSIENNSTPFNYLPYLNNLDELISYKNLGADELHPDPIPVESADLSIPKDMRFEDWSIDQGRVPGCEYRGIGNYGVLPYCYVIRYSLSDLTEFGFDQDNLKKFVGAGFYIELNDDDNISNSVVDGAIYSYALDINPVLQKEDVVFYVRTSSKISRDIVKAMRLVPNRYPQPSILYYNPKIQAKFLKK